MIDDIRIGNTTLIEHGIQTERSTMRAHVCVNAGIVYVFPTKTAAAIVNDREMNLAIKHSTKPVSAWTYVGGQKIETARGIISPPSILSAIPVKATRYIGDAGFSYGGETTDKGDRAVWVVQKLLKVGWFPLPINSTFVTDAKMQIEQGDIIAISGTHKIEVKCDYQGGEPRNNSRDNEERVTGNLFLQTHECNPLRQY